MEYVDPMGSVHVTRGGRVQTTEPLVRNAPRVFSCPPMAIVKLANLGVPNALTGPGTVFLAKPGSLRTPMIVRDASTPKLRHQRELPVLTGVSAMVRLVLPARRFAKLARARPRMIVSSVGLESIR